MGLRDYLLGILSAPLSDPEVTPLLAHRDDESRSTALKAWLLKVQQIHPTFRYEISSSGIQAGWIALQINSPYKGKVGFRFVEQKDLLDSRDSLPELIAKECSGFGLDLIVLALCADETNDEVKNAIEECWNASRARGDEFLVLEPSSVAAIILEQIKPIIIDQKGRLGVAAATAFFEEPTGFLPDNISIRRFQPLLGTVMDEPGTFTQKWRELQKENIFGGPILLCTTFLPPVTHSSKAVERFYGSKFGATGETLKLVKKKINWEREIWEKHIKKYERYDIVDRGLVEEYFAAPEYYQMPVTVEEVQDQLANILELLEFDNYKLCLTPEAVDISYEIRGSEVRIRTDRRNKGQPRLGRISGIILSEPRMADVFEREFWSMYRQTEPEFKDKKEIAAWLTMLANKYQEIIEVPRAKPREFDVFLCHNSIDKAAVKQIGKQLIRRGIRPWLDEWELPPGRPWQRVLEEQIEKIKSVAVFVGESGLGPWAEIEVDAFLREFVKRHCPAIPVILPTAREIPKLPVFLEGMHWVDFRKDDPNPIDQLIWGVTGRKTSRPPERRQKSPRKSKASS
ncbi:MAG: toll/interleukin-1 receptor domain-containing protein [Pyrinomonadaceae bacterium]